ncbi:hypothetical protein [Paracoccus tegillarcae]|uniref:Uncharacterized protein n=1 Tax=Paracoccus tegillarcae TaxID=1529068 RepID=A0A2K9EPQ0_9RHOB|nr:hypothetical protein [Paracoccus tegillarcae]AUH32696.1 hypothetical protein CUV01_04235 [Paracoccus tegillarcae]
MNGWSHPVAAFWAGEDLSFVEQMVILSYLDQGCDFTLYLGHAVKGVPEGTTTRDADEVMARPAFVSADPTRKQLAVWSDLFRIRLLQDHAVIWADLDAYCLRPYDFPDGYAFGENGEGGVLSGVLALPPASAALRDMADFLAGDDLRPPWSKRPASAVRGPADLPWGDTGPRLLTHALQSSGEISRASPPPVFYPLFRQTLAKLWRPGLPDTAISGPDTLSVHIFGVTKRVMATYWQGLPPPNSWLARAAARHGIRPDSAPATGEPLPHKPPAT